MESFCAVVKFFTAFSESVVKVGIVLGGFVPLVCALDVTAQNIANVMRSRGKVFKLNLCSPIIRCEQK
jgi:hypothetical protein